MFFLMEFVRLVNKNKWMKEIKDWIYEWKMLILKNCLSECFKYDNGNFICKMLIIYMYMKLYYIYIL